MTATIQTILLLLAVLVVVAVVAKRLNTAPSILLVIAGIALALIPGLPRIELAPELVLLGILPPLIYSAGVAMSWREFRFNLRPIALLRLRLRAVHERARWRRSAIMCSACRSPSASCSAPSSRRPTSSPRSPSSAVWACRGGWSWCSRARGSPTTPPP